MSFSELATCGDIFCESMEKFIGDFSAFFDVQNALVAEFDRVIYAIEQTQKMSLTSLRLKCDFVFVCVAFTTRTTVPLMLCNR